MKGLMDIANMIKVRNEEAEAKEATQTTRLIEG